MPRFPAYLRRQLEGRDEANIERATRHCVDDDLKVYVSTRGGDTRKLRGIPAIGPNVTGAIPGTTPGRSIR